jgi:hypothetical protein
MRRAPRRPAPSRSAGPARFLVGRPVSPEGASADAPLLVVHLAEPVFAARIVEAAEDDDPQAEGLTLDDVRWMSGRPPSRKAFAALAAEAVAAVLAWEHREALRAGPAALFLAAAARKAARHRDPELAAWTRRVAEALVPDLDAGLASGAPVFPSAEEMEAVCGAGLPGDAAAASARAAAVLAEAGEEAGFRVAAVEVTADAVSAWLSGRGLPARLPVPDETLAAFLSDMALMHSPPATALEAVGVGAEPAGDPAAQTPVQDDNGAPPDDLPTAPDSDPFLYLRGGSVLPPWP